MPVRAAPALPAQGIGLDQPARRHLVLLDEELALAPDGDDGRDAEAHDEDGDDQIDADLQDPPELILEMSKKWKEGNEVVFAVRAEREGESWFKLWTASLFYRIISRITDVEIPLDTGDFRLMDRKVVSVMNQMRERHGFLRGMSAWVGFKQVGV